MQTRARVDISDGQNILVKAGECFELIDCISTDLDLYLARTQDGTTLFAVDSNEIYQQKLVWQD